MTEAPNLDELMRVSRIYPADENRQHLESAARCMRELVNTQHDWRRVELLTQAVAYLTIYIGAHPVLTVSDRMSLDDNKE